MINKILVVVCLLICISYIIYILKGKKLGDRNESDYTNFVTLRSFIMALVLGICLAIMIIRG